MSSKTKKLRDLIQSRAKVIKVTSRETGVVREATLKPPSIKRRRNFRRIV